MQTAKVDEAGGGPRGNMNSITTSKSADTVSKTRVVERTYNLRGVEYLSRSPLRTNGSGFQLVTIASMSLASQLSRGCKWGTI